MEEGLLLLRVCFLRVKSYLKLFWIPILHTGKGHKATALTSPDSPLCTRVRPHSETLYLDKFWIGEAEGMSHSWHMPQVVRDLCWLTHVLTMYDAWTKMLGYQIVYFWSPFTVVSESLKSKKRLKTFAKLKTIISLNFSVLCITLVSPCWQLVFWAKAITNIFSWFFPPLTMHNHVLGKSHVIFC